VVAPGDGHAMRLVQQPSGGCRPDAAGAARDQGDRSVGHMELHESSGENRVVTAEQSWYSSRRSRCMVAWWLVVVVADAGSGLLSTSPQRPGTTDIHRPGRTAPGSGQTTRHHAPGPPCPTLALAVRSPRPVHPPPPANGPTPRRPSSPPKHFCRRLPLGCARSSSARVVATAAGSNTAFLGNTTLGIWFTGAAKGSVESAGGPPSRRLDRPRPGAWAALLRQAREL
jgi:hypothetical protein